MEIKWINVTGSYRPEKFKIYDNKYAIFTQNVEQINEDTWKWQELAIEKGLYDFVSTIVDLILENK